MWLVESVTGIGREVKPKRGLGFNQQRLIKTGERLFLKEMAMPVLSVAIPLAVI